MRLLCSLLIATLAGALLLTGCMPESRSGNVYTRDQARTAQSVSYGTLQRVDLVAIEGTQTGAGMLAGGALGGALGSAIGGGSGRTIATVGGAIAGGIAGAAAEKGLTKADGVELEVRLDNGETMVIVQENDAVYQVGQRVRVVRDGSGTTRVRP